MYTIFIYGAVMFENGHDRELRNDTHSVMPHSLHAAVSPLCLCAVGRGSTRTCAPPAACSAQETILFRRAWAARLFDEHVSTDRIG